MSDDDLAKRVYREFGPDPLRPEREGLYVDLDPARGNADVVTRLEKRIRFADAVPTCQVLAGHRGSGKSTELLRLKKHLEEGEKRFFVVRVAADEDIDRNDVDFPEILIAIVRQMAAQLDERFSIKLEPGYFKDRLQRIGKLLTSEIDFDKFDLQIGLLKLAGKIKGSPEARAEIRRALEPDTNNLLVAANDVISEAALKVHQKGMAGLVILMDDLDKMVVREHAGTGCNTDEYLFVNRAAQLTAFHCHVVYVMPLSLAYSHHEQAIRSSYGDQVPVLPMTKIAARPPSTGRYESGMEMFRDIIARRLNVAGTTVSQVFATDQVRDELIDLSGGQPTELMTMVREAIIAHDLPIDNRSLDRARREGQQEYARQLRTDHWPIIEQVRISGRFHRTTENEPVFRQLLESRAILQYVNDTEWYGLNPMVAALEPPTQDDAIS